MVTQYFIIGKNKKILICIGKLKLFSRQTSKSIYVNCQLSHLQFEFDSYFFYYDYTAFLACVFF